MLIKQNIFFLIIGMIIGAVCMLVIAYTFMPKIEKGEIAFSQKWKDFKLTTLPADSEYGNKSATMGLYLDSIPFLVINKDENQYVLSFFNSEKEPIIDMKKSLNETSWSFVHYGPCDDQANYKKGYNLLDIDFNGEFDVRYAMSEEGKRIASYIFINNRWHKVDGGMNLDQNWAVVDWIKYNFEPQRGWVIQAEISAINSKKSLLFTYDNILK